MPIVPNGSYLNPDIAKVASNLGIAIFGDPEARMKRDLYGAQTQKYQADTAKTQAETGPLVTRGQQYNDLPATIGQIFTVQPGESAQDHAARVAPFIGQFLQAGGGNANEMGSGLQNLFSTAMTATGDDDDMRRGLVIQGKMPGKDFAGTAQRADAVSARDAGEAQRQAFGVANINQAGETGRNATNEAGRNDRFYNTPIVAAPGNSVYLAPSDPRYGKVGDPSGVVRGNSTKATVQGEAGARMLAGDASPMAANIFNGSGGVAKPGAGAKPKAVTGKALDDAVGAAAAMVGAAARGANGKVTIDPQFETSFDTSKVAAAREAAGAELATSGNAQRAGEIYLKTLGVQPGSTFKKPGTLSALFGGKSSVAPTVTATAAPAAPVNIPPPAARPLGMKATGKDGVERTWTANGWVAAQQGPVY